jgi:hypothetical protein
MEELREAQASVAVASQAAVIALGYRQFGTPVYAEHELRLAGSWSLRPDLALGIAVRGLLVQGAGLFPRRGVVVDAGFRVSPEAAMEVGAVVEAVAGAVPGDPPGHLRRSTFGATRRLPGGVDVHLEVNRREDRQIRGVLGMSWQLSSLFVLRAGVREEPLTLAWGFTARVATVSLVVAASHAEPLGKTIRIGIVLSSPRPAPKSSRNRSRALALGRFTN